MDAKSRELVELLQVVRGDTRKVAIQTLKALTPEGHSALLSALRKEKAARASVRRSERVLPEGVPLVGGRVKKIAYSLLLPPDMLAKVKLAASRDGSSVSQFIRTAIARQLGLLK